jgi:hypothetical protein
MFYSNKIFTAFVREIILYVKTIHSNLLLAWGTNFLLITVVLEMKFTPLLESVTFMKQLRSVSIFWTNLVPAKYSLKSFVLSFFFLISVMYVFLLRLEAC